MKGQKMQVSDVSESNSTRAAISERNSDGDEDDNLMQQQPTSQ